MENNTKKCPKCITEIDKNASVCPNCKTDLRNWFVRHWIISIFLFLFIWIPFISWILEWISPTVVSDTVVDNVSINDTLINWTDKQQNKTVSQKNVIRKAKSYLDMSGFSRNGLIKQLKFEKFSEEDAIYAVDNIIVDWNTQAKRKAETYLDMSGFSRDGLIKQLKFEGFTDQQAIYGVESIWL